MFGNIHVDCFYIQEGMQESSLEHYPEKRLNNTPFSLIKHPIEECKIGLAVFSNNHIFTPIMHHLP